MTRYMTHTDSIKEKFSMEELQNLIIRTVDLHEGCFNHEMYNLTMEDNTRKYPDSQNLFLITGDPKTFYLYSLEECAEIVCIKMGLDLTMARFIDLALSGWWNDVIDWAQGTDY